MYTVTIHPFFRDSPQLLMSCPGKKITVLSGCPFVLFLAWCPGFVPTVTNCAISLYKYLCIGGQKLGQILSVYTKKSPADRAPPRTLLGELTMLPRPLSWTPNSTWLRHSHPATHAFDARPAMQCSNYGHLRYVVMLVHADLYK